MKIYREIMYGDNFLVIDGENKVYSSSESDEPFFNINLPGEKVFITKFIIRSLHPSIGGPQGIDRIKI